MEKNVPTIGLYITLALIGLIIVSTLPSYASTSTVSTGTNPSTYGDSVLLMATVAATGSESGIPTGSIAFYDGGTSLGSVPVDPSGTAFIMVSTLSGGSHSITVQYSGDSAYAASTSAPFTQTVSPSATYVDLSSASTPSAIGGAVAVKATVSGVLPGGSAPSGTIRIMDGGAQVGTGTLDSAGIATITTTPLSGGLHMLTAVYAGDTNYAGSTSPALPRTISISTTTVEMSSSANPSTYGKPVTFTATVKGDSGIPAGTVRFDDGMTLLGTGTLDSAGHATLTTSSLSAGTHSISATYLGDSSFYGSSSAALAQKVVTVTLPVADFSASQTSGVAPLSVRFTDASTGNPTSRQWNFGDGTPDSAEVNPVHTYSSQGVYTVTLTVANADGSSTARKAGLITVTAPAPANNSTPTPIVSPTPVSSATPVATPAPSSQTSGLPATIGMGELYSLVIGGNSQPSTASPTPVPLITSEPMGWPVLNGTPIIFLTAYVQPDRSLLLVLAVVLVILGIAAAVYLQRMRK